MAKHKTIRNVIEDLAEDDRAEFVAAIRTAVFHLASCWDALREAEEILDGPSIACEALDVLASETTFPEDAYRLTAETVIDLLELGVTTNA